MGCYILSRLTGRHFGFVSRSSVSAFDFRFIRMMLDSIAEIDGEIDR